MLIGHVLSSSCYRKKLQNVFHLNCVVQICQIWIQLITACGKYCNRRYTKHASLTWSYQRRHWRMAAAMTHDSAWRTPYSVAVSVRPDQWCYSVLWPPSWNKYLLILYTLFCSFTHCNQLDSNPTNLGATVKFHRIV